MKLIRSWLAAEWPAPFHVKALTTLRSGGVSLGSYATFNPAMHVGDSPKSVLANRQRLKSDLQLPSEPSWLNQIHGATVIEAADWQTPPDADACYSYEAGRVCIVMTADCLPILICDRDGTCVCAIHAGWKGLLAGIVTATIKHLPKTELLVWLGPAIGPERFSVGAEVHEAFADKAAAFAKAFTAHSADGYWLADIYRLAALELQDLGIDRVYGGGLCTVGDPERFYSYRRDGVTGRMASLIWMDRCWY
jgi:YfiH family protein